MFAWADLNNHPIWSDAFWM